MLKKRVPFSILHFFNNHFPLWSWNPDDYKQLHWSTFLKAATSIRYDKIFESFKLPTMKCVGFVYGRYAEARKYYKDEGAGNRITGFIAMGMDGAVFIVTNTKNGTQFVAKVINLQRSQFVNTTFMNAENEFNAQREANMLDPVNTVNLLRDSLIILDVYGIVEMEYIDGPTAFNFFRRRQADDVFVKQISKIFVCVGGFLQKWNSLGKRYSDLKPENLLVSGKGADILVKVADFGLVDYPYFGVGTMFSWSALQYYDQRGNLSDVEAAIAIDMTGLLLTVIDIIGMQYRLDLVKYAAQYRHTPRRSKHNKVRTGIVVQSCRLADNVAYIYRGHQHLLIERARDEGVPEPIVQFLIKHPPIWCDPFSSDGFECYKRYDWSSLIQDAHNLTL